MRRNAPKQQISEIASAYLAITYDCRRHEKRRGGETREAVFAGWPSICTCALSQAMIRSSRVSLMRCCCTVSYHLELSFEDSSRTVAKPFSVQLHTLRGLKAPPLLSHALDKPLVHGSLSEAGRHLPATMNTLARPVCRTTTGSLPI